MATQHDVSQLIVKYLSSKFTAKKYHSSKKPNKTGYAVRYSHREIQDQNWPNAEHISLYAGTKIKGSGKKSKIAIPDVALMCEDDKKVKLLVEVESGKNFKKLLHSMGPIAIADVYSPSYKHNPNSSTKTTNYSHDGNDYLIEKIILFILVLDEEREQYKKIRDHPIQILNTDNSKEIEIYFDYDNNPNTLFRKFKDKFETLPGYKFSSSS